MLFAPLCPCLGNIRALLLSSVQGFDTSGEDARVCRASSQLASSQANLDIARVRAPANCVVDQAEIVSLRALSTAV